MVGWLIISTVISPRRHSDDLIYTFIIYRLLLANKVLFTWVRKDKRAYVHTYKHTNIIHAVVAILYMLLLISQFIHTKSLSKSQNNLTRHHMINYWGAFVPFPGILSVFVLLTVSRVYHNPIPKHLCCKTSWCCATSKKPDLGNLGTRSRKQNKIKYIYSCLQSLIYPITMKLLRLLCWSLPTILFKNFTDWFIQPFY